MGFIGLSFSSCFGVMFRCVTVDLVIVVVGLLYWDKIHASLVYVENLIHRPIAETHTTDHNNSVCIYI